ncbi:MAG: hypothetical protein IJV86_01730 [Clostridia bacterium]|nr:hypothetical protein [Clostridia bacterium]
MYKRLLSAKKYLDRGIYSIHPNMRTFTSGRKMTISFPEGTLSSKQRMVYLLEKLFPVVVAGRKNKEFLGRAVYFSNTPDIRLADLKIFDEKEKKVLTFCSDKERWETVTAQKKQASKFFPTPLLCEVNKEKLSYTEEIKEHPKESVENYKESFDKILDWYCGYFKNTESQKSNKGNIKIPVYFQHGDLSEDNVIAGKELCFIDFDHCGEYPIFYDAFYLALHLAVIKGKPQYLQSFINGEYKDKAERTLKSVCDAEYKECIKAFVDVFKKRWVDNLPQHHKERYQKFFDMMLE